MSMSPSSEFSIRYKLSLLQPIERVVNVGKFKDGRLYMNEDRQAIVTVNDKKITVEFKDCVNFRSQSSSHFKTRKSAVECATRWVSEGEIYFA